MKNNEVAARGVPLGGYDCGRGTETHIFVIFIMMMMRICADLNLLIL